MLFYILSKLSTIGLNEAYLIYLLRSVKYLYCPSPIFFLFPGTYSNNHYDNILQLIPFVLLILC